MTNPSTALKDARLRIELNTQDAQARLDALEEAMEEISDDLDEHEAQLRREDKESQRLGRTRNEREGRNRPTMDNTGPGKFGLRNIPQILSASEMAGLAGSGIGALLPYGGAAVGPFARKAIELEQQYGALAEGLTEGLIDQTNLSPAMKVAIKNITTGINAQFRQFTTNIDVRLKSVQPAIERAIEMAKAALVTGGHLKADEFAKFASTSFEWEFVNARKDRDIRDKTLRLIGHEAPGALKDIFMQAMEGNFKP